jgi:hypothetical protein
MFDVPNTAANAATAAAVNARLEADARLERAKARTWLLCGIGGLLALIGIGSGAAFAGYHFSYQKLADTTLKLDVGGATVGLDTTGRTVRLDATGAVVRVAGGTNFPNTQTQQPQSGGKVITNYDIFHFVDFADGQVVTDWSYRSSEDAAPYRQTCNFQTITDAGAGINVRHLAVDGRTVFSGLAGFDVAAALRNCVWAR